MIEYKRKNSLPPSVPLSPRNANANEKYGDGGGNERFCLEEDLLLFLPKIIQSAHCILF